MKLFICCWFPDDSLILKCSVFIWRGLWKVVYAIRSQGVNLASFGVWESIFPVLYCCRSALWWLMQYLIWTLTWKLSMVKHYFYVKSLDVSLMLNVWQTFYLTAVVAQVDQYAEIEYSMVSSPTVSNSSIDLSLKVKKCTPLYCPFYRSEASAWS